ncbi:MAG: hypothetical protein PHE27_01840 [Alphaproteobacteria bacterium]|nr:hypothetical protein [Alphaproteobacteria bacterium]
MIRSYSSLLFWIAMIIASSAMLYRTSDRVNALDVELHKLTAEIEAEQKSIHVLKAEWVYQSNPERIEADARRYLGMKATETSHVASLENFNAVVPMRDGIEAPVMTAQAKPVPVKRAATRVSEDRPRTERDRMLAALNAGRINDHMTMQHSKPAVKIDKIGAMLGKLGIEP